MDWYRNVLAAGHCTLLWHGKTYAVEKSEPIERKTALPVFPPPLRQVLRMLGTQDFVRVKYQGVAMASETVNA